MVHNDQRRGRDCTIRRALYISSERRWHELRWGKTCAGQRRSTGRWAGPSSGNGSRGRWAREPDGPDVRCSFPRSNRFAPAPIWYGWNTTPTLPE